MQRISALPKYEPVRIESDNERMYTTPIGTYHSVTTILSGSRDQTGLQLWREQVGEERADFISSFACFRGNKHHEAIEAYLLHGTEPAFDFSAGPYWKSTRAFLDTIDHPLVMEGALWHPDGYAGTMDCIAYLADDLDQPTLLDWKTADAVRKPDKMYDYSLQAAAYVTAANYVYGPMGIKISQAKIVVALPNQAPQIETLDGEAISQLYLHFKARMERFTYARSKRATAK